MSKKLAGAGLFILSIIGYTCGVPLVTTEVCENSGGTYVDGICFPEGTTFDTAEPCVGGIEFNGGCWDPWVPIPGLGENAPELGE